MNNIFLKAKHWHLFLLTYGVLTLSQIIYSDIILTKAMNQQTPDVDSLFLIFKIYPIVMIIYMAVIFGWNWSVGVGLQRKLPEGVKLNVNLFKTFLIFYNVYIIILMILTSYFIFNIPYMDADPDFKKIFGIVAFLLPIHFFAIFCSFYVLYFVSKTFKSVELQHEVSFSDYAGEFFMLWFFFVGVWILQPKINKMFEEENS